MAPAPLDPFELLVPVLESAELMLIELAVTLPLRLWLPRTTMVSPGWMLWTPVETVLLTLVPAGALTLTVFSPLLT